MPLIETKGAASAQGFGLTIGGAGTVPVYIEEIFSTYLYTGNGSTQTITNGIDLSTKGGLVWGKSRSVSADNVLVDSARGIANTLVSNSTGAQNAIATAAIGSFNSNGFSFSGNSDLNANPNTYASWTFRKQAKFFDVVTYTGNGTTQAISHNLGSVPGCIIVKCSSTVTSWAVYHRSVPNFVGLLNSTSDFSTSNAQNFGNNTNPVAPTSTQFTVGQQSLVNSSGETYVAYIFAHNAGGFGLTGTDNVISCGSFSTDGSGNATVSLGYEPQWLMYKCSSGVGDWEMVDVMRGWVVGVNNDNGLRANSSDAESAGSNRGEPSSTGFNCVSFPTNRDFIYIAIRRGPMKVPTSGTSVFSPNAYAGGTAGTSFNLGFVPDTLLTMRRNTSNFDILQSRLTGQAYMFTNTTDAELGGQSGIPAWDANTGTTKLTTATSVTGWNGSGSTYVNEAFARAPSFFDEVCYTGTGSLGNTLTHNLGVTPELMIVKCRSNNPTNWTVYTATTGNTAALYLNDSASVFSGDINYWNNTSPTSTQFTVGLYGTVNGSARTYVAYLFATCAGVSKVGSYTGTGALQTVNCGFTGGARFVLIKRTDSTGDWYVYDSARGITSGNDPYLFLNSADAEVTGTNYVDTDSTGFKVTAAAPAGLNASGGTYIFLAIS